MAGRPPPANLFTVTLESRRYDLGMARAQFSDDEVRTALARFVHKSDDLRVTTYTATNPLGSPSAHIITTRLPGKNFEEVVTLFAIEHGSPGRLYRWSTCPNGFKHLREAAGSQIFATIADRAALRCGHCEANRSREAERIASLPTFAEKFPGAVPWLADSTDAAARGKLVTFRCSRCDDDNVRWSPSSDHSPLCYYCKTVGTAAPGDLVPRRGGGEQVQLETDLAAALHDLYKMATLTESGIVVERGAILIEGRRGVHSLPVIKPDVLLPSHRVAVEVDLGGYDYSHHDGRDVRQDRERDQALNNVGWRVLRIREPGAPVIGEWPWRIETKSRNPTVLASLIAKSISEL
jgi:hypothetical protein